MFELSVAGYFHDPALAKDLTPFRVTGRTQDAVWASLGEFDLRPRLHELSVRAMVVHGEDDPIPIAAAELLAAGLRAPLVRIPNCGHVPYVEAPDAFVAALDPFLPRAAAGG
jgi:proline iminopeptidase